MKININSSKPKEDYKEYEMLCKKKIEEQIRVMKLLDWVKYWKNVDIYGNIIRIDK